MPKRFHQVLENPRQVFSAPLRQVVAVAPVRPLAHGQASLGHLGYQPMN
jgi:hypothetical protein